MPSAKPQATRPDPFALRSPGERRYWLVKTEPSTFSFDDLMAAPNKTTVWDGVRNPIASRYLRDGMKVGDHVFFYHTGDVKSVVGICEVVREGYPEPSDPAWSVVDLKAVAVVPRPVPLADIKKRSELANMPLVRIGRLSVSPVTAAEWKTICEMGGATQFAK